MISMISSLSLDVRPYDSMIIPASTHNLSMLIDFRDIDGISYAFLGDSTYDIMHIESLNQPIIWEEWNDSIQTEGHIFKDVNLNRW